MCWCLLTADDPQKEITATNFMTQAKVWATHSTKFGANFHVIPKSVPSIV